MFITLFTQAFIACWILHYLHSSVSRNLKNLKNRRLVRWLLRPLEEYDFKVVCSRNYPLSKKKGLNGVLKKKQETLTLLYHRPIYSCRVAVWCGVGVSGPYFFEDKLTVSSYHYCHIIKSVIRPKLN
ncbi:UNVERIFIED_CONTAM: hypothetical protein NCL1_50209 [Trichonephila clavipes]